MSKTAERPASPVSIRLAAEADIGAINDIYNHYVRHSTCTYQEEPEPLEGRRAWFQKHRGEHPATVAESGGQVIAWGSLSPFHSRCAYRFTVENSIYVHHDHHRRGIGSLILRDLIDRARAHQRQIIVAGIDAEQAASVALHTRFHFEKVGHLRKVGFKFGRWLDVVYMQLEL